MSRWLDSYNNFIDSDEWKRICDHVEMLDCRKISNAEHKIEALRFKRLFKILIDSFEALDPDLVPENLWDKLYARTQSLGSELPDLNAEPDAFQQETHRYSSANNHLDSLFIQIRPLITSEKTAAQQAGIAFRAYRDDVETAIKELGTTSSEARDSINGIKGKAETLHNEIKAYAQTIFGEETGEDVEHSDGLKSEIDEIYFQFQKHSKEIKNFRNTLFSDHPDSDGESGLSIERQITKAKESIGRYSKEAEEEFSSIKDKKGELETFHKAVFGSMNTQTEQTEGGLKHELEKRLNELDAFKKEQQTIHETLKEKIESLQQVQGWQAHTKSGEATQLKM